MKLRVVLEYDQKAESFAAYCPELPGCTSCGSTEEAALKGFREALALYFEPVRGGAIAPDARVVELAYELRPPKREGRLPLPI